MVSTLKSLFRPLYGPVVNRMTAAKRLHDGRAAIQSQFKKMQQAKQPVKVIIGASETRFSGWIPTDIPYLNVLKAEDWARLFQPMTIHRMLAEHVFEHLNTEQFQQFLKNARPYLTSDGFIRIAVPDGNHPDPAYIAQVKPGGTGDGADDHKLLYTYELMTLLLANAGYNYRLLEYFSADGQFHQLAWDPEDGMIYRSADHNKRNEGKPLTYTSIIVDCWPGR